jgi:hypothetical protein
MMLGRRRGAAELLLLLAVVWFAVVVVHSDIALRGKIYTSSDAQAAEAFKVVGDAARAAGEYPLWNPFVFAGMPSFASLSYTPNVYPLQLPLAWLDAHLHAPPMTWLLVHLLLAGFFTAAYARWRGLSLPASAAAGALVVAIPQVQAWCAYGHGTKVGTFAWLPLTLWCLEGVLRRGRWLFAFGLAASLAMQLLRGHVQIVYYTALAGGLWTAILLWPMLRAPAARRTALQRAAMLACACLLALAAAAVIYLPVWEYQAHSIRGAGSQGGGTTYDYATAWSLPPSELDTFWWPTAKGYGRGSYAGGMPFTDYPNYVGAPVLALALAALLLRRDRWCWWLLAVAGLATLVAMGKHSLLYDLMFRALPGFKKFRVPVMILILQQWTLLLLAATGLDAIARRLADEQVPRPRWLSPPSAVVVALCGAVLLLLGTIGADALRTNSMAVWQRARPELPSAVLAFAADLARRDAVRLGLLILASVGCCVALGRRRLPAAWASGAIALGLFLDYFAVGRPIVHPERTLPGLARQGSQVVVVPSPAVVQEPNTLRAAVEGSALTRWLKQQGPRPRVWPGGRLAADNSLAAQQIVSLGGYHPAKLKAYEDIRARLYDREPRVELANLLAAEFVVFDQPLPPEWLDALEAHGMSLQREPVYAGDDGVVYRNRSARPRGWLVRAFELEDPARGTPASEPAPSVLNRVLAPGFDPARTVILAQPPDPAPQPAAAPLPEPAAARVRAEGYNWVEYEAQAPAPAVLVTADIYYPDWSATVDGHPAPVLRADYALRAVALPAGSHVVRFQFTARSFHVGTWISLSAGAVTMLGLAVGAVSAWRRPAAAA